MANPVLIAAPVAIVPAVAALWYLLKRYEEYFDDARVFLTLTFGFFAGLFAIALEFLLFPFQTPEFQTQVGVGTAFLMFVIGYAFFEAGIKLGILGTRRYRGRKDTPYYGAALGLGMGAMMAMGFIAINLNAADAYVQAFLDAVTGQSNGTANGTAPTGDHLRYQTIPFFAMAAVPIGGVLAHGASAVFVGRYVSQGRLWMGWAMGALTLMPATLALALFWPSIGVGYEVPLGPAFLSLAYGIGILFLARSKVLDHIVPPEVLAELRKAQRREARAAVTGKEATPARRPHIDAATQQVVDDAPDETPKLEVIQPDQAEASDAEDAAADKKADPRA